MTRYETLYRELKERFAFPEKQIENRTETQLASMLAWARNYNQQSLGWGRGWTYKAMGDGEINENFFALARVEKR